MTQTYLDLRTLENTVISELNAHQQSLDTTSSTVKNPIKISISQFYGIEINDFAVTVAKTALWMAEYQMMKKTEEIIQKDLDFLPLTTNAFIQEGNALRISWESVVSPNKLTHIIGNPPFNGAMLMKKKRGDIESAFPECSKMGEVDYVSGWYAKAAKYIKGTNITCALVSTNSICQGQSVELLWKPMFQMFGIKIDFAYTTFVWDSEALEKAHVHVVIVGFSMKTTETSHPKMLYNTSYKTDPVTQKKKMVVTGKAVSFINAYLTDGADVFVTSRSQPLCDVPKMYFGNMPRDGGYLILTSEEKDEIIHKEP